jgi:hypothetical protein
VGAATNEFFADGGLSTMIGKVQVRGACGKGMQKETGKGPGCSCGCKAAADGHHKGT